MEEKIFYAEKLDFKDRIKKGLLFKILTFFIFFSMILLSVKGNDAGIFGLIFTLFLLTVIVVTILQESINYIDEVRIGSQNVTIFGQKFNRNWEVILDIKKVNIRIIERRSKAGSIVGYMIVLSTNGKNYRINKLFNWNNFTLYELFSTFKSVKGEKIIIDEKSFIDGLEKRARDNFEWKGK